MSVLTGLPALPLLLVVFGLVGLFAVAGTMVLHHVVRGTARENSSFIAAAYMTAIGSLFAIFSGFLLNGEYTQLRDTQKLVFEEAAAGSRLAYSTQGLPEQDAGGVQTALTQYLDAVVVTEWPALGQDESGSPEAATTLKELQRLVFVTGSREGVNQSSINEVKSAVADLTVIRRARLAVATQGVPAPLLILSAFAGLALVANALVVTLRGGRFYVWLATGIVVVVALELVAIIAIAAPFSGPFVVGPEPLEQLTVEIRAGDYQGY
jgi:hypothetical protein